MVPFWFLPYAVACGDTFVLKPSRQTPMTANLLYELLDEIMLPPGVVNLVNGTHDVADRLMEHPYIKGVSFVGSTRGGRYIYSHSAQFGKRVQAQGGAKNYLVVMPDANIPRTVAAILTSAYGCAGQRCLAGSNLVCLGGIEKEIAPRLQEAVAALGVGYGLDPTAQMGPVISAEAKAKIIGYIDGAEAEGAEMLVDGRGVTVPGYEKGFFVGPTLMNIRRDMAIAREEVFGPTLGIIAADGLDDAIDMIHENPHGNAASIFTASGGAAREFKYRVFCGNIGVNVGIAAPMATFPFGGMKDSFFGDLHGQGRDGIEFFTDRKWSSAAGSSSVSRPRGADQGGRQYAIGDFWPVLTYAIEFEGQLRRSMKPSARLRRRPATRWRGRRGQRQAATLLSGCAARTSPR